MKNKKKDSHVVNITGVKAIWIIASCITVAALILAHTFYLQSKEEIINQFNREQLMLAKEASMKMEEFYSSLERTLRLAAHLVAAGESETSSLGRLSNIYAQYKDTPLANIAVIGPGGEIVNYAGGTAPGKEVIPRSIYETVKGTPPGQIYVSSLQDMPRTEPGEKTEKGFFLASAARISMAPASGTTSYTIDTAEAVIVFSVSLHKLLEKYVRPIKSSRNGHAWVLDNRGTLLFQARHPEMVFRNIFSQDESCRRCHSDFHNERKMVSGLSGTGRARVAGSVDNLVAYYPVKLGQMIWSIAVTAPYSEVSSSLNRLMKRNGFLVGFIMMLFIGSTVLTNRYVKAAVKAREEARYLKEEIALKTMLQKSDMEVVRLAAAIESMDTLVLLTDLKGEIFYLNPAAEKGFGFSLEELASTNIELLFAAANPPGTFSSILAETAQGGWEGDCFILNKDNAEIPVHLISSPVKERSGNNISMTWSMQDLTETKELQYKLIQYEKMRALGVLAAGVAHDFNNILAIILTNTQIILSDLKSDKFDYARFKQKLEAVQEATRRGVETVRRLKIYANQEETGQRVMNLNEIISEAIFITEPQWKKMKLEEGTPVKIETSFNPLPDIRCTHLELLEVFINIIVNSVEAMPNGGNITIITRRIGEYVVASISDTGQGMEDEVREQIFDLFFSTKGPARSGLGLSTALSTIQRHRGQIKVWSKQGAGATFDILLPVFRRTDDLKSNFKNILSDSGAEILVIEDDVSSCNIICSLLSSNGYAVCCKNDDASGLEKFKRKQFDLVLTRVTADDIDGMNLPEEIKQIKPSTPVIAMSSWHISEKKEDRLKKSGIDFILAKPIESFDLFNTVERALQGR